MGHGAWGMGHWAWGIGHWALGIDALEMGHAKSGFTTPYCPFLVLFVIIRARVAIASVPAIAERSEQ